MLQALIEPLQYGFMQRSLIIAILVGLLCAIVGSYLMVQRLALLGDAISHSVLPGLAIAFMIGANIFVGAFIAGVLSTMAIAVIKTRSPIKEDAAMGIVFSAFFALGVTLITVIQKDNKIDLNHFLFGNILGVTVDEVRDTAIIAAIVLIVVFLLYKELLFYTFDPLGAQAAGLPVNRLKLWFNVVDCFNNCCQYESCRSNFSIITFNYSRSNCLFVSETFTRSDDFGAVIGVISSISGMYLSYFYNLPSGPAIVLVVSGLFTLALLFSPRHGILIPSVNRK